MGADILERLDFMLISRRSDEDAIIRDARAEIVRLRGEVEALLEDPDEAELAYRCGDPDSDAIAPAEAKDPAPAMPNGVEALRNALQRASNRIKRLSLECPIGSSIRDDAYEWAADADATLDTPRAADNRDAAGVDHAPGFTFGVGGIAVSTGKYREEPAVFLRGVPERGVVGKPVEGTDLKAVMVFPTVEQMQRVADALVNATTHAAVPAGEAVAFVAVPDDYRNQASGYRAGWTDAMKCTPQPADGEAVATVCAAARARFGPAAHPHAVADWIEEQFRATPPAAPVQAAPQEGGCTSCETEGVFATDGSGPFDCYACGKKAAHPSACELGAVRVTDEMVERGRKALSARWGHEASGETAADIRAVLEAALQHRGDSQEVGRG